MLNLSLIILFVGLVQQVLLAPATIDQTVLNEAKGKQTMNVIVSMRDTTTSSIAHNLKRQNFATRAERLNTVAKTLREFAEISQKNVLNLLKKEQETKSFTITVLWITNQILIRGADGGLLEKLVSLNEISNIGAEKFIKLDDPIDQKVVDHHPWEINEEEVQWGVKQIEAPTVWSDGNRGQGIIVGTIDTGVRVTHEALKYNYVGDYGWYDPNLKTELPNDQVGHGTHTTANIAGTAKNVGVAPGSKWMSCRGCAHIFCSQFHLLECGQWMVCPTKPDLTEPDCSRAPHLVSNSWGGGSGNTWYTDVIDVYHAARIIPIFSMGNSGPDCGSANSPGDYDNLIGVGSTTLNNVVSDFSSVGPTVLGSRIKPDVAAPGSDIFSAYVNSDTSYSIMSGTSMAAPHVAGVVALLLSESPNLTYEQVKVALRGGSVPTNSSGMNCADIPETQYPNHHVGSGRINAHRAISVMRGLVKI